MIKQIFRYRKLTLVVNGEKHQVTIPYYGPETHIAIDKDGMIFSYDRKPNYNPLTKYYEVDSDASYDHVANYEGDYSDLRVSVYHIKKALSTYTF